MKLKRIIALLLMVTLFVQGIPITTYADSMASGVEEAASVSEPVSAVEEQPEADAAAPEGEGNPVEGNTAPVTDEAESSAQEITDPAGDEVSAPEETEQEPQPTEEPQTVTVEDGETTIGKTVRSADGTSFTVKIKYGAAAEIPEGTVLSVKELVKELTETERKMPPNLSRPYETETFISEDALKGEVSVLSKGLNLEKTDTLYYTKFLDLSLTKDGQRVEPKAPVEITVETADMDVSKSDGVEIAQYDPQALTEETKYVPLGVENRTGLTEENVRFSNPKTVSLRFYVDRMDRIALAGVAGRKLSWTVYDMQVSVYGPRTMKLTAYEAPYYTAGDGRWTLATFTVQTDPYVDYGTTLWMDSASAGTSVDGYYGGIIADQVKNGKVTAELFGAAGTSAPAAFRAGDAIALIWDSGYRSITLTKKDVTLEGIMPMDASVRVVDVTTRYENSLPAQAEDKTAIAAYDITMRSQGQDYQPGEDRPVTVSIDNEAISADSEIEVWHMLDDGSAVRVEDVSVEDGTVRFAATGFSVYVIVSHEGGEIFTPRVEFHFLSEQFTEDSEKPGTYTAAPFFFANKGGTNQNSEIVKSGETLEMIMNPPNIEIQNDDGTVSPKYFYGWYIVDEQAVDADGNVTYTWTEDPEQLVFEQPVTIDPNKIVWADTAHTAITSLVWELHGVEHTVSAEDNTGNKVVLDEFGCIHVYLAPIYQDYYFINFHAGTEDSDLGNSIITRRLVVLGSDGKAEVRIGDVKATSTDSQHKIFTGWEGQLWDEAGQAVSRQEMTTLDEVGEEYNSGPGKDGFYITVDSHDLYPGKLSVDLYPIFTEARWFHFRTGASGNGATYVGDTYVYTTDQPSEVENGTARYYLTDFATPSRTGYRFKGWFADPTETDSNGDYIDGTQITDENGRIVNTPITKFAADGVTPIYQLKDGKLYVYKDLNAEAGVTLYAHWEEVTDAKIQVIIWRQKVSDSKNAYDYEKTYDFEAAYTVDTTSGLTLSDLRANNVLRDYEDAARYKNYVDAGADFTGFHFRTSDMNTATTKGDGTTVVNVYYDRDLMTIYFYYNGSGGEQAYTYTETTADNPEEQYGIVEGKYVRLVRKQGSGMKYTFRYDYQQTTSDTITPQFALVSYTGGVKLYEELTREVNTVTNTRWQFRTGKGRQKTTRYMDQGVICYPLSRPRKYPKST